MNALAYFKDLMIKIFKQYLDVFVIVFIDEILIYSQTKDNHVDHLRIILQVIKDGHLIANLSKCEFWLTLVAFLSHIISGEGI